MPNAFDLTSLFSAEGTVRAADAVPVSSTSQRFQTESTAASSIGTAQENLDIAIGQHNATIAQSLADVEATRASKANIAAVDLASKLEGATAQLHTLRDVANIAQTQQGALLQERQKLTENFPGWLQNPLGRVTAAYKISQLDEKLAGLQKNAELATQSSNELTSRIGATIREESQAEQLRLSGQYNEDIALVRQENAGKAEVLNGYASALNTLQEENKQQITLTQASARNSLSQSELQMRKDAAARAKRAEDTQLAQVEQAAKDWLSMKQQPHTPENLNRARMLVGALSAEDRVIAGKMFSMAGNGPLNPLTVKRNLVTSGASLGSIRRFGTLLGDPELTNAGASVYDTARTVAVSQLTEDAYKKATSVVEGKDGRYINGMAVTQEAWWAGLKPAERNAITEQADAAAKQKMETSSVDSINMLAYGKLQPNHQFSITANTPAEVTRVFGYAPGSPEHKVMLDPTVRAHFDAAGASDPSNAGPQQFRALFDAFKAAGSADPAAATAKAITAYSRGYAATTSDGKWLRGLGVDLPAYYIVRDANGQSRNLANPEELRKYMLLSDKARTQSKERGFFDKVGEEALKQFGDGADAKIAELVQGAQIQKLRDARGKTAGASGTAVPEKKLQGGALKKAAYEVRASSLQDVNNFGTDKLPAVTMDISGELNAAELRNLNSPEQVAARAAKFNATATDTSMRDVLESRARENAASIAAMQKADGYTPINTATAVSDIVDRVSRNVQQANEAAAASRENALWKKGGGAENQPAPSTATADLMDSLQAVQTAQTPAAKEQGFLELVRDLYKRAFGGEAAASSGAYEISAQQQAAAAAEYEAATQGKK